MREFTVAFEVVGQGKRWEGRTYANGDRADGFVTSGFATSEDAALVAAFRAFLSKQARPVSPQPVAPKEVEETLPFAPTHRITGGQFHAGEACMFVRTGKPKDGVTRWLMQYEDGTRGLENPNFLAGL